MELTLMTFSMMRDIAFGKINAEKLCQIAAENSIHMMDIMEMEVKLYGEKKLQDAMKKYGITCGCLITAPAFYTAPDKVEQQLTAALDMAKRFGSRYLMVVPGQTVPKEPKICAGLDRQEMLDIAVEKFTLAVDLAKKYDIQIGFENTPHAYKPLASAEDCKYVLEHVPGLGLIFDTGNFRVADTSCDEMAIYEMLKDYIIRVHLKDVVVGDFAEGETCVDGQKIVPVATGSGIIPMKELLLALKKDGYTGALAIEYSMKKGVHGTDNAQWVNPYATFIRSVLDGSLQRPPYARIEGIALPVSRIFFGTAIGSMMMGKNAEALLDAVYGAGINAFDCARGYGRAEKVLGEWVKARNNRDRVVLLTKCGNVSMSGKVCVNRNVIEKELATSLKTLQTDYIDIYLLHRDDPNTPVSEVIDCLNEMKQQGKIKVFGVSNWTHQRIEEANAYASAHGLEGFCVSSPNFGLAEQVNDPWGGECVTISGAANADARAWYAEKQMPVIAYSSLGRGFFSGKFHSGDYEGAKKVLDNAGQKGYLHEVNMTRLARAEELAARDQMSVSQIAMRYIFSNEMNVFAVVSTTNPNRMRDNIAAANAPLSAEDVAYLEQ